MKTKSIVIALFLSMSVLYGQKKMAEVHLQTSAQCLMCKEKIEYALAYEKGVKDFNLNLETGKVYVKYKTNRTNPEEIKKAISKIGYDAYDVPANPKAYEALPDCCKKPEDGEPDHSEQDH